MITLADQCTTPSSKRIGLWLRPESSGSLKAGKGWHEDSAFPPGGTPEGHNHDNTVRLALPALVGPLTNYNIKDSHGLAAGVTVIAAATGMSACANKRGWLWETVGEQKLPLSAFARAALWTCKCSSLNHNDHQDDTVLAVELFACSSSTQGAEARAGVGCSRLGWDDSVGKGAWCQV